MSCPTLAADPAYARLKSFLIETTGLAYYETRDEQLAPLLQQRIGNLGGTCAEYLEYLQRQDAEVDRLVCDLTIGETYFFRHAELFDALRNRILPAVLRAGAGPLRIWSAGCSIGAEAYSLSILLRRDLAHLVGSRRVTIIGTDINRRFLTRAQQGRFGKWALRGTSEEVIQACFRQRDAEWEILPAFRDGVTFRHHNLVGEPFPADELTGFDIVLCRNVMIYFEPAVIHRLLRQFTECVVPGGWLLVGHADPGPDSALGFDAVCEPGAILYRRRSGFAAPEPRTSHPLPSPPPRPPVPPVRRRPAAGEARRGVPAPAPGPRPAPAGQVSPAKMRAALDRGDWDAGVALCSRALEEDPFATPAYYWRALALEQGGKHGEAERDLRRVVYLDRGHALAHFQLGRLLLDGGRREEAASLLRAAGRLVAHCSDADPAGEEADVTVGELRALVRVHTGEAPQ